MIVLIACEESQAVTIEFRRRGHQAYSCDLQACSGNHPEWHIMHDAVEIAYTGIWDLIIAFPPCTYISKVGNAHFNVNKYGQKAIDRLDKSEKAKEFFKALYYSPAQMVCIENPVGFMSSWKKPTQIVHPYYFGDNVQKATCLWLRGLSRLNGDPTNKKPQPIRVREGKRNRNVHWSESLLDHISDHAERLKLEVKHFLESQKQWLPSGQRIYLAINTPPTKASDI